MTSEPPKERAEDDAPAAAIETGEQEQAAVEKELSATAGNANQTSAVSSPQEEAAADATVVMASLPAGELAPDAVISNTFRIRKLIGRGGMGQVYLAEHTFQRTQHALKRISPHLSNDEKCMSLFRREAELLRKVTSEAIVGYDGVIVHNDAGRLSVFLAMEFAEGPSLKSFVRDNGPLAPEECLKLLRRVASGLAAAHERGVFHRDMSPDNIILTDGSCARAKIIDFGIAREGRGTTDEATILGGGFAGKLGYAAPEQFGLHDGVIDARTDIYALGLSIFFAATGRALFNTRDIFDARESRLSPPALDSCPDALRPILARMLAPDPAGRPKTMAEVISLITEAPAPPRVEPPMVAERKSEPTRAQKTQSAKVPPQKKRKEEPPHEKKVHARRSNLIPIIGGVGVAAALLAAGAFYFANMQNVAEPSAVERLPSDRGALAVIKPINEKFPGCVWLPKADDRPDDGAVAVLAIPVAGNCSQGQAELLIAAEAAKVKISIVDGSSAASPELREVIAGWTSSFGDDVASSNISILFENSAGKALRGNQGIYVGDVESPGVFSVRIEYYGSRQRLFPDIVRSDGFMYRNWQPDSRKLRVTGWQVAGVLPFSLVAPDPEFLKPENDDQDSLATAALPTRREYLAAGSALPAHVAIGESSLNPVVGEPPANVAVGAVAVLATDAPLLPCSAADKYQIESANSKLSPERAVHWTKRIADNCLMDGDEFKLALFVLIPPNHAGEFILD